MSNNEYFETVIIGGGQAGLVAGYELRRRGRPFVILDASSKVGDAWRNRWDSLRLFTPGRNCGLPGLRFTATRSLAPTKDEMADYLERYAEHHELPIRHDVRATRLSKNGDLFRIETSSGDLTASNVVVATGSYKDPNTWVRCRARPAHRSTALLVVRESRATAAGRRAAGRRGQLGGGHQPRRRENPPDLGGRPRTAAYPGRHRQVLRASS